MHISDRQERYGDAYLGALAAVAGYGLYKPEPDHDSVDWGITARGGLGSIRSPRIEVQMKCPFSFGADEHAIRYDISRKNYDDLRDPTVMVPRILIVVCLHEAIDDWIGYHDEGLTLRRCAYWASLAGEPDKLNSDEVRIRLPRSQRLTVDSLRSLMQRAGAGEPI